MTGVIQYKGIVKGIAYYGKFYPLHPGSMELSKGKVGCVAHFKLVGGMNVGGTMAFLYEEPPSYGRRNSQRKTKT